MRVAAKITPAQFLQNISAVVNGPGWGTCPSGTGSGLPTYSRWRDDINPLPPLVDITGGERRAEKTGRNSYSCRINGLRIEERVKRPTHDVLRAVYSVEDLIRTRSAAALRSAGAVIPPAGSAGQKRLSELGSLTIEQMAVVARKERAGRMRESVSEFAMDFAEAAEETAGSDPRAAASLALLAGVLFAAGRKRDVWAGNAAAAFDFSSRQYLIGGSPASAALAGEIALRLSPREGTVSNGKDYTTAEVTSAAWNHVMISPSISGHQQRIALHRGLRASLMGRVWYSARHFYTMSALLHENGRPAAREHVRSAWTEAMDVVEGKMLFFESRIESKLRSALNCLNGAKRNESDTKSIRDLLTQAERINARFRGYRQS